MAFASISSGGVPTYSLKQGIGLLDNTDERPTVVTQNDADRLNVISTSNSIRTVVNIVDATTVSNSSSLTTQVIEIPDDVDAGHFFFDSTDTTATFTFKLRMTSSGNSFSSPSLSSITLSAQREAHLFTNLKGVPFITIDYSNSSGSSNTLSIWFVHASTQPV
jgi:hypothetical protein